MEPEPRSPRAPLFGPCFGLSYPTNGTSESFGYRKHVLYEDVGTKASYLVLWSAISEVASVREQSTPSNRRMRPGAEEAVDEVRFAQ